MSGLPSAPIGTFVDLRSGQVWPDITEVPTAALAGAVTEIQARTRRYAEWRKAAEAELLRRLSESRRRSAVVDGWDIQHVSTGRARVWDADDLELTLRELVDENVLRAGEITGLIRTTRSVDGTAARDLLAQLDGDAKARVEACFRWERKGSDKVTVTKAPEERRAS